jgi:hypothetical protein
MNLGFLDRSDEIEYASLGASAACKKVRGKKKRKKKKRWIANQCDQVCIQKEFSTFGATATWMLIYLTGSVEGQLGLPGSDADALTREVEANERRRGK